MEKTKKYAPLLLITALCLLLPSLGFCSVETTLDAMQAKLINKILPAVAILGLVFAAFSFFTGSPNARSHLWLAIIGAVVGFGAPSIVNFVQSMVH